jgi:putative tryptophan/tyrosine transport system substrate-binding protein
VFDDADRQRGEHMLRGPFTRRYFVSCLGGAAATWPLTARAQQRAVPVVGFLSAVSPDGFAERLRAFRQGLKENGYVEGDNVTVAYRWAENQIDQLPALAADLVRRQVAVIVTAGGNVPPVAAKAATGTIPIVFAVSVDPVGLGLVASLARPGGNATGINFFAAELMAKRLGLLRELVPAAVRVAVIVNPANVGRAPDTRRDVEPAAHLLGLQIQFYEASTSSEIDGAYATLVRERPDALFVAPDGFFTSRRVQLTALAARHALPAAYSVREFVEAGGLMSYGTSLPDMYRQVGVYAGRILKNEKPADLPVVQATKFELVINLQTARLLGLTVPPTLLARADEVVE